MGRVKTNSALRDGKATVVSKLSGVRGYCKITTSFKKFFQDLVIMAGKVWKGDIKKQGEDDVLFGGYNHYASLNRRRNPGQYTAMRTDIRPGGQPSGLAHGWKAVYSFYRG
jgi:hypothetical protein